MDTSNIKKFIVSRNFSIALGVVFLCAILVGTFSVGLAVGYRKAEFSYAWGENYHQNFGGPRGGFLQNFGRDLSGQDFIEAHGIFGKIIKINNDSTLIIQGGDNVEKVVTVTNQTEIRRFHDVITIQELSLDEPVVIIGEPDNQGRIAAKFIRVMPPPLPPLSQPQT